MTVTIGLIISPCPRDHVSTHGSLGLDTGVYLSRGHPFFTRSTHCPGQLQQCHLTWACVSELTKQ